MVGKHHRTVRSKQTGRRCRQPAIPGGNVCRYHGGAAPQVQQAARLRLAALVDPAIDQLAKLPEDREHPSVMSEPPSRMVQRRHGPGLARTAA